MSLPVRYFIQRELMRCDARAFTDGVEDVVFFDAQGDWRATLSRLEAELPQTRRAMVFGSIQVISQIRRSHPRLAAGAIADFPALAFHAWSGRLPAEALLNRSAMLIPFGWLASRKMMFEQVFGERIFLRPDASTKAFPGQVLSLDALDLEVSALRQIHHLFDDTLVVVDRARKIAPHEYRFWLSGGDVLTWAPYAHEDIGAAPHCPRVVHDFIESLAGEVALIEDPVVADVVLDEIGTPRIVELNGFSTSGFYQGFDFNALACGVKNLWGECP